MARIHRAGHGIVSCLNAGGSACSGVLYCAYHSSFRLVDKAPVIYATLPYNTPNDGCGDSALPEGNRDAMVQISTLAHEQFEAANDPLVSEAFAEAPPLAWYYIDPNGSNSEVIADLCNQEFGPLGLDYANVTLNGHRYKVQSMFSNDAGGCVLGYYPFRSFVPMMIR